MFFFFFFSKQTYHVKTLWFSGQDLNFFYPRFGVQFPEDTISYLLKDIRLLKISYMLNLLSIRVLYKNFYREIIHKTVHQNQMLEFLLYII